MLRLSPFRLLLTFCALSLLAVAGCSGKKPVTVKGTVILPTGVQMANEDLISVTFEPETKGDKPVGAKASITDKSFTGKLVPGKYKVSVQLMPYSGSPGSEQRKAQLQTYNKVFGAIDTKMTCEVTAESPEQSITIDLTTGTIKK